MATTYQLISSQTLASSAASVTFSAIPSTYTDLVLKTSLRSSKSTNYWSSIYLRVNGSSSAVYSYTELRGTGTGRDSVNADNQTQILYRQSADGDLAPANTFSNNEFYFPQYAGSAYKVVSSFDAQENNSTDAYLVASAGLISATAAITSITISEESAYNWLAGSSFYLYGISNA
jgi:hypothetical protein